MKYATYSEYKASGVEWLDVIPSHWTVKAARFGYSIQLGKMLQPESSSSLDVETPYLKSQHVQWESVRVDDPPLMWASPSELVKYGIQDGDLLVCEGGDVGRAGIVKEMPKRTIIQNALHRVRPRFRHDIRFLMYVLEHASGQSWFDIICNRSTIAHFTGEKFGALRVPAPPLDEQQTIARFLDAKTAQIDALVAQKRQLIDKLKEKRQALIARTVTRGLPPEAAKAAGLESNPEMKDSGVEWLGMLPASWTVKKLKHCGYLIAGSGFPHEHQGQEGEELPFFKVANLGQSVDGVTLQSSEHTVSRETAALLRAKVVPAGSIAYAKIGAALLLNRRRITTADCCIDNNMTAFVPRSGLTSTKWAYYFLSIIDFSEFMNPGAIPSFSEGYQADLPMLLPPSPEQEAICAYLASATSALESMVAAAESTAERLLEYRQALITSAVTGKIDVRGLA